MTQLKTLKDIKASVYQLELKEGQTLAPEKIAGIREIWDSEFVERRTLRSEAIKWIKNREKGLQLPNDLDGRDLETSDFQRDYYRNDGVIKWVKHFFNLSEEDLK